MSNTPNENDPLDVNPTPQASTANPYATPQAEQVAYVPPHHGQSLNR